MERGCGRLGGKSLIFLMVSVFIRQICLIRGPSASLQIGSKVERPNMISIRRIRLGEADLFRQIRLAALQESPAAFGSTYESALRRGPESWQEQADSTAQGSDRATFLAFESGAPIGIMALYRNEDGGDSGELLQVWVDPAYKGKGVATAILDAVFEWAGRNGFRTIIATVAQGNDRALKFYKKSGFVPASDTIADATDGLVLAKEVQAPVITQIVFETHSLSEDNGAGRASGWNHSRLSAQGRALAAELGQRRRNDGLDAVFTSDLGRAVETAHIAFDGSSIPIFCDWRLRECDYGEGNGMLAVELHQDRSHYLDNPYPGGESWRTAVARVERFLDDLPLRWAGQRVLVIGHVATRWALDFRLNGVPLEDLMEADFDWKEGWEYELWTRPGK